MEKTNRNTNEIKGNGITELVFILDRSGSMSGLEKDTIGGFNSMIEKQKKQDGECYDSATRDNVCNMFLHTYFILFTKWNISSGPSFGLWSSSQGWWFGVKCSHQNSSIWKPHLLT